jgi:hypothetical protein
MNLCGDDCERGMSCDHRGETLGDGSNRQRDGDLEVEDCSAHCRAVNGVAYQLSSTFHPATFPQLSTPQLLLLLASSWITSSICVSCAPQ